MVDAALATRALFVVFLGLFGAAAFRWAALTGRLAAPDPCLVAAAPELFRFRFRTLASAVFIFARGVLPVLRATRGLAAGLLLRTRFRALDEAVALEGRFEVGFTRDAGPVFFVFELVGFLDFLRAAIVNLSTREHHRIRSDCVHEHCFGSVREYCSSRGQADFLSAKPPTP